MFKLGAGNQRIDRVIGLDLGERVELIGKRHDPVTARFQHAPDDQSRRAARVYQRDVHGSGLFIEYQALS
jgi:hypothetical protein